MIPDRRLRSRAWAATAVAWAWLSTAIAVGAAHVTIASGGYQDVLRFAMTAALVAAVLFTFAIIRGGLFVRVCAALGVFPLLFVVEELVTRYQF